ncbi:hypothetical protein F442_14606 [Phytophthora nicotianae P10297]|uniref:ZSWIM1/3 RNaseH-like domain-containing protein n=2 Tax=Phytophthora nicotianae P10297 TaxID=1317064 RepID=W2YSF0_PHYNI|nr:hypothetical protein F442_14606 [Phytophthora nicotianae P10297]
MNRAQDANAPAKNRQRLTKLRDLYAALGIEGDDDSSDDSKDQDASAGEDEDYEEGGHSRSGSDGGDLTTTALKQHKKGVKTKQKGAAKARSCDKFEVTLSRVSPHLPLPSRPLKKQKTVPRSDHSDNDEHEESRSAGQSGSLGEYTPRVRRSKHLEEIDSMNNDGDKIVNAVPPFAPKTTISSWRDFEKQFTEYMEKNNLKFRNHTHSHSNSETQASSYLTTATLPLDNQDLEDVKILTDARVSSTQITNFLNDRIVCKVTPQQTRNLIRSIMRQDLAQDRMKDLLHALRQLDGSDVLVIQDQLDITCGVLMQTKVQKMMFDRWGEYLTMDFTHSTNNLGYHLGSLVVTTCTGRGFPVVDFMCLNENAVTISSILKYFKEKNPGWKDVKSVVIDKDFVEWQVLEQTLPNAQIVVKRKEFRLRVADREDLLDLMTKLLYCRTQDAYQSGYDALKEYCRAARKSAFFAYFEKKLAFLPHYVVELRTWETLYCWEYDH